MKRQLVGLGLICACVGIGSVAIRADDVSKEKELRTSLIGTWRMVSMKVNDAANDLPNQAVTLKHVTPEGFTWLSYEKETGKIFRAGGGTYTLRGNTYTEKVDYGMGDDFDVVKGGEHPFTARVDVNRWMHTGKLSNGTTIDEVWERVKPSHDVSR